MSMPLISNGPPWYGLDAGSLRRLEVHEARAHEQAGRRVVDFGDAVLLHDPAGREPFLNRLSALRLPELPAEFDRRLADLLRLYATLDRRPHLWLGPGFYTPPDLADRLRAEGFAEVGAAYLMLDVGVDRKPAPGSAAAPTESPARIVRVSARSGHERSALLELGAMVLLEAFGVDGSGGSNLARELDPDERSDVYVAFAGDEPVAAGRRFTTDGATYLSSIGTRPGWRGRGFGTAVTRAMVRDARRAAPDERVHLAVDAANERARAVYRRVGFAEIGDRAPDFLLG